MLIVSDIASLVNTAGNLLLTVAGVYVILKFAVIVEKIGKKIDELEMP